MMSDEDLSPRPTAWVLSSCTLQSAIFLTNGAIHSIIWIYEFRIYWMELTWSADRGPDYMSRAGPVSRAASVCRDDFLPGITWGEPARLMTDAMNHGRPERAWFWCDKGLMSPQGARTICLGSRLLFYSKCTRFTVFLTYSHISLTVYINQW